MHALHELATRATCWLGSTVIGPTSQMDERSSREVAADDAAIHLRNHSIDAGVQISMLVTSVATSREGRSFGKLCCRAIASKAS